MIVDKITPEQRRRSMKLAIISSVASVIAATCGAGNILSLAAIKLGAGEAFLGFFAFISVAPFLLGLCTMSTLERVGKIRLIYPWYLLGGVFAAPLLLLPFVVGFWPAWFCLLLLAAANCLRNAATAFGSTGWFPMLQDIVPRRYTGRFFARIRTTWQSANFVALITAALVLGRNPGWLRFELIFAVAIAAEIIKALPVRNIVENPPPANVKSVSILERLRDYWDNPEMRHYTVYLMFYYIASMSLEPFKVKLLSDFGYGYGFILASTAMVGFGAVITLSFWGRMADRFGNRAIFGISHIGLVLSTAAWLFVGKNSYWGMVLVMALYFFWSVFNSGNQLAQTNYMLRVVPSSKQNFLTIILLVQRLATAVAPLCAGLFLSLLGPANLKLPHITFGRYDLLFILVAAIAMVPHFLRRRLKAKTDTPTSHVIGFYARPVLDTILVASRPLKRGQ
jgi:hypothetical protein